MSHVTHFGLHSQTTRLQEEQPPARRGPLPASHRPRVEPRSGGLRPSNNNGQVVFCTPDGRGFGAGLFPLRSPLLRESLLVSFPPLRGGSRRALNRPGTRNAARGSPVEPTQPPGRSSLSPFDPPPERPSSAENLTYMQRGQHGDRVHRQPRLHMRGPTEMVPPPHTCHHLLTNHPGMGSAGGRGGEGMEGGIVGRRPAGCEGVVPNGDPLVAQQLLDSVCT
ncbi:hypothetical protein CRENBAI_007563 [Crenichthys baileyi]|uniref:Uncharacterized protein n=1 Tax=Crenichthys baileyi TaxID=28760 RepID=A0AAV9SRK5_9TELE